MPKRPCPDESNVQPIKKQQKSKCEARDIRSPSAEKTLQLLYKGSTIWKKMSKNKTNEENKIMCSSCSTPLSSNNAKCNYCEGMNCWHCLNCCYKCKKEFCRNCAFLTYDDNEAVCYSCYSVKSV